MIRVGSHSPVAGCSQSARQRTDPTRSDTDGDGVPDGQDPFPLDPTRWTLPAADPSDHIAPTITLTEPHNATLLP